MNLIRQGLKKPYYFLTHMPNDYHSALVGSKPIEAKPIQFARIASGIAFVHDMANGWPELMDRADVIYSDLPWTQGYILFHDRAKRRVQMPYTDFIAHVGSILAGIKAPAIMITGKHAIALLMPNEYMPITLNGDPAVACLWRIGVNQLENISTETDLLRYLSRVYKCIGDPFCGYGRAGRIFAQAGKQFVMSDLNSVCIGYIAEHGAMWHENIP